MTEILRKQIAKCIRDNKSRFIHNSQLFDIFEGDLLNYLLIDLQSQLSKNAFEQVKFRLAPINILNRVVDKRSKIYAKPPRRTLINGNAQDQELFDWYVKKLEPNVLFQEWNEFFNLFNNSVIEPFLNEDKSPAARVIPSDRFLVLSDSAIDPQTPTVFLKSMGTIMRTVAPQKDPVACDIYFVYTKDEFTVIDDQGEDVDEVLARPDIAELAGEHDYGVLPFTYINRSKHSILPKCDQDTLKMTKIVPIILSDLNYAVMYQCFSIIYGVNVDEKNLTMAPSAFWSFKSSDDNANNKPEIGVIKPQADIQQVLELVKTELAMWFQSKNIKPGAMGSLTPENLASGVAKVVDEMDTSDDRKKQVPYFIKGEKQFWKMIMHSIHPVWAQNAEYEMKGKTFSPKCEVEIEFAEQIAVQDPVIVLDNVIKKLDNRLTTRKRALKELNPDATDDEISKLMEEIDQDPQTVQTAVPGENPGGNPSAGSTGNQNDIVNPAESGPTGAATTASAGNGKQEVSGSAGASGSAASGAAGY